MSSSGSRPWCGGSLLSARHVLTAAHCTVGSSPSSIRVLVGEHDTTDSVADIRTITAITDHPSYNNANTDYDFSILTLAAPITFSRVAAPVCLPASASSLYTGQVATVTGWGTTSFGGSLSSTLLEVDVTVVSNGQCSNSYSGIQKYYHLKQSLNAFINIYILFLVSTFARLTPAKTRVRETPEARCLFLRTEGKNIHQQPTTFHNSCPSQIRTNRRGQLRERLRQPQLPRGVRQGDRGQVLDPADRRGRSGQ